MHTRDLARKPGERDHLDDLGVDGMILEYAFKTWDSGRGLD